VRYGFVIDQRKCIGCHACTVACKEENRVPLGVNRTWVKYVEKGTFPDTRRYFAVLRCNHCDQAPCVTICPTRALYRRRDGIVDLDGARCIGCKSCMQACPYDALYIDPATQTAAKCHYCAHRVEVGLEPACAVVCPVQAIVAGDLDDPNATIARLVASEQVQVRKPEQGTRPKVFYLGVEASALTPGMQRRDGHFVFATAAEVPVPGERPRAGGPVPGGTADEPTDIIGLARTVYDVTHPRRTWAWKVSAYLWTKSVAAGALLVATLGILAGPASGGSLASIAAPMIALCFLGLTTMLLILDLKRPERFLYLLLRPNWRSWLVWGAWILIAYGAFAVLWLTAGLAGSVAGLMWLAVPTAGLASATAAYSAFLFGQAEGRDFWQSPLRLPHLLVAAASTGTAALLVASGLLDGDLIAARGLRLVLLASLGAGALLLAAELFGLHPTRDAGRAARLLTHGELAAWFWSGVVLAGTVVPGLLLAAPWPGAWIAAAVLTLGGSWLYEELWIRAGQAIPLS
jgi:Fe-S-cluster-containing dehydrogenase component/formate-dependent nitrite reductase membrane component NrfD